MENKFEKIAIGLLAAAVLALGAMLIFQQKAINQAKYQISAIENGSLGKKAGTAPVKPLNPVAPRILQEAVESLKVFPGEIKSAAADSLDVEVELSKLKNPDKTQSLTPDDFDKFKKMIKVSLNDKTQYLGLKKEDLKIGDKVFVTADNSPFKTDSLTALRIVYSAMKK